MTLFYVFATQVYGYSVESTKKEIRFHIPDDLVGMAIGREGANVNEARRIPGVTSVEFDDYSSTFCIKGEVGKDRSGPTLPSFICPVFGVYKTSHIFTSFFGCYSCMTHSGDKSFRQSCSDNGMIDTVIL